MLARLCLAFIGAVCIISFPAVADPPEPRLYVDAAAARCDDAQARADAPSRPFCTLTRAAQVAQPGDEVLISPGRYTGTLRPARGGRPEAPIRFTAAEPGVVLDAAGAANAVRLIRTDDVVLRGMEVTGGANQGVWVEDSARVRLERVTVRRNPGAGVQLKAARETAVDRSALTDNGRAGLLELPGASGTRVTGATVTGNGRDGEPYNGAGIQLGGTGATVSGSTISGNGDSQYEHGVYTGTGSSGWRLTDNVLDANAGAGIKAGGTGAILRNRIRDGRWGVVLSDNPQPVAVIQNLIHGRAQHQVFVTAGALPGRGRLWQNSIVQQGRALSGGDASTVFVLAAGSLELRNNLIAYTGNDAAGVALWINDAARVGTLTADTNWFAANDSRSRHLAFGGSRVTLATWRERTGQDARSISSWAPVFDAELRVTSTHWGIGRGDRLDLGPDFPVPTADGPVDIGAYMSALAVWPPITRSAG
jgi:hypothetical protein